MPDVSKKHKDLLYKRRGHHRSFKKKLEVDTNQSLEQRRAIYDREFVLRRRSYRLIKRDFRNVDLVLHKHKV